MKSFMKAANSLAFAAIMGLLHSAMDEMYFLFLKSMISWKELAIFLEKFLDCKGGDIYGDISMGGPPSIIGVLGTFS